jgi:DnaJ-like protein
MSADATAFPLTWPAGLPRTAWHHRKRAAFKQSIKSATDFLKDEVRRMDGRYPVISSGMELRRDGLPYAQQRQPADPGVAVYFLRKGKQMTFACDRWDRVHDNLYAIAKTIEAIRGIERWGSSDMMERAFAAFEALPAPRKAAWWEILGVSATAARATIEAAYREKAKAVHPDRGGSREAWDSLASAYEDAKGAAQ